MKLLSRVRLCDLMDYSLPGSSVHGIFQARVLEWGAIAFSDAKINAYILVNSSAIICIQNLLCMLNSLGFIPRRGNAGSFGNSVLGTAKLFSTSFKFTQQCMWFQVKAQNKEKAMGPHSSTLAWKIPWTEEPGGLQSMGS